MFRKLSIVFVFAAILSAVMHSFIPHHEHGEFICFEQTHDTENTTRNDCTDDIHTCCFDKQDAVKMQNKSITAPIHDVCCAHCFPTISNFSGLTSTEITNNPYLRSYTSADIVSVNALRGPPLL